MKNLMPEVAKLLGVEIEEEFRIKKYDNRKFKFYKDGLKMKWDRENEWNINNTWLMGLYTGEDEIVKLPWKPKNNEQYWTVEEDSIFYDSWDNNMMDYSYLKLGNCFRTKEEAEANADRIRKEIMG